MEAWTTATDTNCYARREHLPLAEQASAQVHKLSPRELGALLKLPDWPAYLQKTRGPNFNADDPAHWTQLTEIDYKSFIHAANLQVAVPQASVPGPAPAPAPTYDADEYRLHNLEKRILFDVELFPKLIPKSCYVDWRTFFYTQLSNQGMSEVRDPEYRPVSPTEKKIFDIQQSNICTVLSNMVNVAACKDLI